MPGFIAWLAIIGTLLLTMSLATQWIQRSPLSIYSVYLLAGMAASPLWLGLIHIDVLRDAAWLTQLTTITLIVSLFIGGLKLRLSFSNPAWRCAGRLALPGMILSIVGVAMLAHGLLGFDWPLALVLGAMLAPTDPVLASQVSVDNSRDHNPLHIALSGEAGCNDGTALPFLLLGLTLLNTNATWPVLWHWAWLHVLWAIPAGLVIGFGLGWVVGRLATRDGAGSRWSADLLALALILLSYAAAESLHASGFLAAFAAGLGLRSVERSITDEHADASATDTADVPAETAIDPREEENVHDDPPRQKVGKLVFGALIFGDSAERLLGTLLVLLVGIALADYWNTEGVILAAALFLVIRPLSSWIATAGLHIPWRRRALLGWLGIRGIGSLNYLAYALTHGLFNTDHADFIAATVITVIVCSIGVHGISARPMLRWLGEHPGNEQSTAKLD